MSKEEIKVTRISQSLMKAMREYLEGGECGIRIREQYIKGKLLDEQSKAMKLGCYAEYILTGALPKNKIKPEPEYMASVVKKNKGSVEGLTIEDMYDHYRKAHAVIAKVKDYLSMMGLVVAKKENGELLSGVHLVRGRFEGTIDVILEASKQISFASGLVLKKGERICVDIKYSGTLDDKWSVHGWQWTPLQKKYHGTQAKQYHYLTGIKMFFLVIDPGGDYVKLFHCLIDEKAIEHHISEGNQLYEALVYYHENDLLEARPEVSKCRDCALFNECGSKHLFPHAEDVDLKMDSPLIIE